MEERIKQFTQELHAIFTVCVRHGATVSMDTLMSICADDIRDEIARRTKDDVLLDKFFEKERWEYAITKGELKDIKKSELERLTTPEIRLIIYWLIALGAYNIAPPNTAEIPKPDSDEMRIVMVNEPIDRIVLSISNDLLFDTCPDMVHRNCYSYQKGIGCGKVVKQLSEQISMENGDEWWKGDLRHYFDDVARHRIDWVFDEVEKRHGHSAVIDMLRRYYYLDLYYDTKAGEFKQEYKALKQGCSVASFLADAALFEMDRRISDLNVLYARYCDDFVIGGKDAPEGMAIIREELAKVNVMLHPKKLERLSPKRWFKFLGFSIKGKMITMSHSRLDKFVKLIEDCTYKYDGGGKNTPELAMKRVFRALYVGNGEFSWATAVLPVINVDKDIQIMNTWIMDAIRAVGINCKHIGGLGYQITQKDHVAQRYPSTARDGHFAGFNEWKARKRMPRIEGYYTIKCMQKAMLSCRDAYDLIVREMAA